MVPAVIQIQARSDTFCMDKSISHGHHYQIEILIIHSNDPVWVKLMFTHPTPIHIGFKFLAHEKKEVGVLYGNNKNKHGVRRRFISVLYSMSMLLHKCTMCAHPQ